MATKVKLVTADTADGTKLEDKVNNWLTEASIKGASNFSFHHGASIIQLGQTQLTRSVYTCLIVYEQNDKPPVIEGAETQY